MAYTRGYFQKQGVPAKSTRPTERPPTPDQYAQQQAAAAAAAAAAQQAELDRIARERQAIAAQQQAQMAAYQQQLLSQQNTQAAQAQQLQAQQAQRLGEIAARGMAVAQSLKILAIPGSQQGPTASMSQQRRRTTGARTAAASLRIGAMGSGTGAGANFSV
jgi:hypothetical protein